MKEPIKPRAPKKPIKPFLPSFEKIEIYRTPCDKDRIVSSLRCYNTDWDDILLDGCNLRPWDSIPEAKQFKVLKLYALSEKENRYTITSIWRYSKTDIENMSSTEELFNAIYIPKEEISLDLSTVLSVIPPGASHSDITISCGQSRKNNGPSAPKISHFVIIYNKPISKEKTVKYEKELAEYETELAKYKILQNQYKKEFAQYKKDKKNFDKYMKDVMAKARKGLIAV